MSHQHEPAQLEEDELRNQIYIIIGPAFDYGLKMLI